jgi:hypothetical protein
MDAGPGDTIRLVSLPRRGLAVLPPGANLQAEKAEPGFMANNTAKQTAKRTHQFRPKPPGKHTAWGLPKS